tara:strand:- start:1055 stop:1969 length:915 start_codon:yes stop_codon:yes gene_type:complete
MTKILILGTGSIAQKHYKVLSNLSSISDVKFFSKRNNYNFKKISSDSEILNYNPDYIIICSETHRHYTDLKKINSLLNNKKILVEKPLFHKKIKLNFKLRNKVFVGYQLRYHPIINKFKKIIERREISFIKVICNSYLPNWRPRRDYSKSYSANSKRGGGVLLDLSHEIDYLLWILKNFKVYFSHKVKISKLRINSEDYSFILAKYKKNKILIIQLDYFSKNQKREIELNDEKFKFFGDLKKNFYKVVKIKNEKKRNISKINNHELIKKMHKDILSKSKIKKVCTLTDGVRVLNKIEEINKVRI